jgi:hypothetical protein
VPEVPATSAKAFRYVRLASVIDEAGTVPAELADDPRFAGFLYQLALQLDLTGFVSYR